MSLFPKLSSGQIYNQAPSFLLGYEPAMFAWSSEIVILYYSKVKFELRIITAKSGMLGA